MKNWTKDEERNGEGLIYEINGVENETTINQESFNYGSVYLSVLVTDEGEYFNIYVLDERFKAEPMNCLKLQEPKQDLKKADKEFNENDLKGYFNKMRLEMWALEHYLWAKYSTNEKVLSFSIEKH